MGRGRLEEAIRFWHECRTARCLRADTAGNCPSWGSVESEGAAERSRVRGHGQVGPVSLLPVVFAVVFFGCRGGCAGWCVWRCGSDFKLFGDKADSDEGDSLLLRGFQQSWLLQWRLGLPPAIVFLSAVLFIRRKKRSRAGSESRSRFREQFVELIKVVGGETFNDGFVGVAGSA